MQFARIQHGPGPLSQFMHGNQQGDMSQMMQRGRDTLMHSASDLEHFVEQNATTLCVAGFVLGTFIDTKFYLIPLAIGGLYLYRNMQQQSPRWG